MMTSIRRLPVVLVLGATGTGKSKLAIEIAEKFNGEIISADSMQVYTSLDIVTNKVTAVERSRAVHHMIDFVSPLVESYTVVDYKKKALPILSDLLSRGKMPIIVGGTNYYIESLVWNFLLDDNKSHEVSTDQSDARRESGEAVAMATGERVPTSQLYERMLAVDPDSVHVIHPNDRRKIIRALEVYAQHGRPMSQLLAEQHVALYEGAVGGMSGPLLHEHTCAVWLQCDREVLDQRTDARVDDMVAAGLVAEMTAFHDQYNKLRLQDGREADYTRGIFQTIGFKEFHKYLLLNSDERQSDTGKQLFDTAVEDMKRATRQYARRQVRWIVNRFEKRRGRQVPPLLTVNGSDLAQWHDNVWLPTVTAINSYVQGEDFTTAGEVDAVPVENDNIHVYNTCAACGGRVFVNTTAWKAHLASRRHKENASRLRRRVNDDPALNAALRRVTKSLDNYVTQNTPSAS